MLSTVFNPSSDVFSGFLSDWNERGWIVKHQGNLKSDYRTRLLPKKISKEHFGLLT